MKQLKEQFAELGYCHIPQFISPTLLNEWADDLHWLVATQLKRFGLSASEESDPVRRLSRSLIALWRAKPEAQSWIYEEVNRRPWMFELASSRLLTSWVREILGSERIAIHPRLNMIMNMPGHEWHVAYWHQDRFYGPQHHVVAYIPLQNTGAFNGGLVVAPGEHKRGLLPHAYDEALRGKNKWITLLPEVTASFKEQRQLELMAGDLVLFDGLLPHSANLNRSEDVRFAVTLRYTDLTDPFFIERGWRWQDLAEEGQKALARKENAP